MRCVCTHARAVTGQDTAGKRMYETAPWEVLPLSDRMVMASLFSAPSSSSVVLLIR